MTHKKPTKEINHGADAVFRGVMRTINRVHLKFLAELKAEIRAYRKRATKTPGGIGRK